MLHTSRLRASRRLTAIAAIAAAAGLGACGSATTPGAAPSSGGSGSATPTLASATTVTTPSSVTTTTATAPSSAPSATLPATSAPPAPGSIDTSLADPAKLVLHDVTEPCPDLDDRVDIDATSMAESARLEPLLAQVLHYGSQHADVFGGYALHWVATDRAEAVAAFVGDLDAHRQALQEFAEDADDLVVCQVAVNEATADALTVRLGDELRSTGGGGYGRTLGGATVILPANALAKAADLKARYGDAIKLTVGMFPYPLAGAEARCEELPATEVIDGLKITISDPGAPVAGNAFGAETQLTVEVHNTGTAPVRVGGGTAAGSILDAHGKVVSAVPPHDDMAAVPIVIDPGGSAELPVNVTIASCDPALGYVVPPGEYMLVATLDDADRGALRSEPLTITVGS
jgi:hypothetical protein